jgi:pantetheine-phosphate adenylyltransferase
MHNGHFDIIEIASNCFDRVVIGAIRNPGKPPLFTLEERKDMIEETVAPLGNVDVVAPEKTLTVDVAREVGADVIVKGLRVAADFEYELQQAQMNKAISGIQTLFIPCGSANSFIASTLVKEIAKFGGADRVEQFVPTPVFKRVKEKFA